MIYVVDSCDAENLAISSETFSEWHIYVDIKMELTYSLPPSLSFPPSLPPSPSPPPSLPPLPPLPPPPPTSLPLLSSHLLCREGDSPP